LQCPVLAATQSGHQREGERDCAMPKICCDRMDYDLQRECPDHPDRHSCPDALVAPTRNGFGLIVHDGGSSTIAIAYCPWCGKKLPTSDVERL
jgi:hypothetical protein